jgi:TolB protein
MKVNSRAVIRLTRGRASDALPAWAPSRAIAFVSERAGDADIYVMSANGTGVRRLTSARGEDFDPDWSPNRSG